MDNSSRIGALVWRVACIMAAGAVSAAAAWMDDNPGGGSGTTYYVDAAGGNDTFAGTSEGQAWASLTKAVQTLQPGDTVLVKSGDYTESMNGEYSNLQILTSGTAGQYITYRAYPGHRPRIHVDTWNGIELWDASYIELDGFEVVGLADPASIVGDPENSADRQALADDRRYVGNGISVFGNGAGHHHIRVRNCWVHRVGGNGIAVANASLVLIESNRVWNCAHRSKAANSGISLISMNDTVATPLHYGVAIVNNVCYDNINMLDFQYYPQITDGNAVILDTFNDSRGGAGYAHRTLIANNVCFNNGGRGVHLYNSDHADVVNNTCYQNVRSADLQAWEGELNAVTAADVAFENNIAQARPGVRSYQIAAGNAAAFKNNAVLSDRNDQTAVDASNLTSATPLFVAADTNEATAVFQLAAGSPVINAGRAGLAPASDIVGVLRPQGAASDLGAYEYVSAAAQPPLWGIAVLLQ